MVDVIDDWKVLKEHIVNHPNALLEYRIDSIGEKARLRVCAGTLGVDKIYDSKDEEFDNAVRFLDEHEAVVITKQVLHDVFFL